MVNINITFLFSFFYAPEYFHLMQEWGILVATRVNRKLQMIEEYLQIEMFDAHLLYIVHGISLFTK